MIRDDTRQTIRFIIWIVVLLIIFYIGSIFVFFRAGTPTRQNDRIIAQAATRKTPITNVQIYYHLDRGTNSYSLKGTDEKGKTYYFVYLTHSKKAFVYPSNKGTSQSKIENTFKQNHNEQIKTVNLGWYQGKPVWEIAFQNKNGQLGYILYNFRNGKEINEVANL